MMEEFLFSSFLVGEKRIRWEECWEVVFCGSSRTKLYRTCKYASLALEYLLYHMYLYFNQLYFILQIRKDKEGSNKWRWHGGISHDKYCCKICYSWGDRWARWWQMKALVSPCISIWRNPIVVNSRYWANTQFSYQLH